MGQEEFDRFDPEFERRIESEIIHVERDESHNPDVPENQEQELPLTEEQQEELRLRIEAEEQAEERQRRREANPFWQFISGNWLILESVTVSYGKLMVVAVALIFSVASIFISFHLSEVYTTREKEVQLLRERSLEYQRVRFNSTSHSAIVKELTRRGIPLYDMQESKTIIE